MMSSEKDRPLVGVVILNYNRLQMTMECIESLQAGTYRSLKIIVVDNGSEKQVKDALKPWCSQRAVTLLDLKENTGFCKGTNLGSQLALEMGCDFALWLNNDTIVDPQCVQNLVCRAESVGTPCAVTGKISYAHEPERLWYAGGRLMPAIGIGRHYGFRKLDHPQWNRARQITYLTGCLVLLPAQVLKKAGFLEESLFAYLDDTEYSFRLRRNGIPIWYEPAAKIQHRVGGGTAMSHYPALYLYLSTRNRPFVTKNPTYRAYLVLFTGCITILKLAIIFLKNRKGFGRKACALALGLADIFRFDKAPRGGYNWMSS